MTRRGLLQTFFAAPLARVVRISEPSKKVVAKDINIIGSCLSYNFKYVAVILDGPSTIGDLYRYRIIG